MDSWKYFSFGSPALPLWSLVKCVRTLWKSASAPTLATSDRTKTMSGNRRTTAIGNIMTDDRTGPSDDAALEAFYTPKGVVDYLEDDSLNEGGRVSHGSGLTVAVDVDAEAGISMVSWRAGYRCLSSSRELESVKSGGESKRWLWPKREWVEGAAVTNTDSE